MRALRPTTIARRLGAQAASRRHASTLIVAEHDGSSVTEGTLASVTAAAPLGDIHMLVGGEGSKAVAEGAAKVAGVTSVSYVESASLSKGLAEEWAPVVMAARASGGHTHIVAAASAFSKSVLPRVAALLDVAQLSDVLEVKDESTFIRPVYAGNALTTVASSDEVKVLTVRPTAFEKAAREGGSAAVQAMSDAPDASVGLSEWVSDEVKKSDRPELASAKTVRLSPRPTNPRRCARPNPFEPFRGVPTDSVPPLRIPSRQVVSGGRGLKTGENFAMLDSLALKLNAAVGASRAAVDSGMCPNDMQVGQTGKVVAPDLYIAVGISGAIQHLAGMKDSKTIVAINKDPEAPIFQVADYGLVDDLFTSVPDLEKKLS